MKTEFKFRTFFCISTLVSGFVIFSAPVKAQECPQLSGRYKCDGSPPYPLVVEQATSVSGFEIFHFQTASEGRQSLEADGMTRPFEISMGSGTVRGNCARGQLNIYFDLTTREGKALKVEDRMYIERKAIVRIRRTGPNNVAAFVCHPDLSRR